MVFSCSSYKKLFKILPNYTLPLLVFQGPLTLHFCLTHPSLLRLLKWSWGPAEVTLPTCAELVLTLKHALLERVCAEHADCPSDYSRASTGAWHQWGYLCACVVFLPPSPHSVSVFLLGCQRELFLLFQDMAQFAFQVVSVSGFVYGLNPGCFDACFFWAVPWGQKYLSLSYAKHVNAERSTACALLLCLLDVKRWKGKHLTDVGHLSSPNMETPIWLNEL